MRLAINAVFPAAISVTMATAANAHDQGWAKFVLIALERYSVELKRLTFNFR